MTHTVENAEIKPYVEPPMDAIRSDVDQYYQSFNWALQRQKDLDSMGDTREKMVLGELVRYLAANYDPRPLDEVLQNIRSIVAHEIEVEAV